MFYIELNVFTTYTCFAQKIKPNGTKTKLNKKINEGKTNHENSLGQDEI
jgi:hypothetical protein